MSYPTIATVLHGADFHGADLHGASLHVASGGVCSAITAAAGFARRWDAHLHALCLGVVAQDACRAGVLHARDEAAAFEKSVSARLASMTIRWDVCTAVVPCDRVSKVVADRVRFHDLVILPSRAKTFRPAPIGNPAVRIIPKGAMSDRAILAGCITAARRPVLILPPKATLPDFDIVQLGWNDGAAAMAAARAALPLMRLARKVDIVLANAKRDTADRSDPGGRLSAYLSCHGVSSEIYLLAASDDGVAPRLLARARACGADVIILGASNLVQGVCADILDCADIPVFLAR